MIIERYYEEMFIKSLEGGGGLYAVICLSSTSTISNKETFLHDFY